MPGVLRQLKQVEARGCQRLTEDGLHQRFTLGLVGGSSDHHNNASPTVCRLASQDTSRAASDQPR